MGGTIELVATSTLFEVGIYVATDSFSQRQVQMDQIHTSKRFHLDFHEHCTVFFKEEMEGKSRIEITHENNDHYSIFLPHFKERKLLTSLCQQRILSSWYI